MAFILDASVVVCWAMPDEYDPVARSAFDRIAGEDALAPGLWWFEVRNTLLMCERRGRITQADTAVFLRGLSRFGVIIDRAPEEAVVLALAWHHRLTVYDASYLELAQREGLALATLDRAMRRAAVAIGVPLVGMAE